jgi:para-nitrobenzyl esterase
VRLARYTALATIGLLLGAGVASGAAGWPQVIERPIPTDPVRIDSGAVAGKQLDSGVRAYFGMPFAAPPVRELRWREPQPVVAWQGVYMALRKQPECIQNLRAHDINHYFGEEPTSEDCLYLNIWGPPAGAGIRDTKCPVVVWIYGGGFTIGSSAMANYDGESLARKGVVFVSLNYRLGVFGFLAHPELTAESAHHASGNYGLLDQVAALRWIHNNIAAFGGDPDNVTIMGQSAGSMSVFQLQASPLTARLFEHAVGMSGGPGLGPDTSALREGEQTGQKYQAALKAVSLAAMRQLPADKLLAIQNQCIAGCPEKFQARPIVDGYFMPQPALQRFANAQQNDVSLMLGFAHDESWAALMNARTLEEFRGAARTTFGDESPEFLKLYRPSSAADVSSTAAQAVRDGGMASVMRTWARAQKQTGKARVWFYMYSHAHPYAPGITFSDHDPASAGAYHTSEVPYFLQTQDALNLFRTTREWTPYDRELADEMSDCIVAFARTGNPATARVSWPSYELAQERLVDFGARIGVTQFRSDRMNFMATAHLPGCARDRASRRLKNNSRGSYEKTERGGVRHSGGLTGRHRRPRGG